MLDCFLSAHVHLCVTEDHVVLLDLRHDRYLALGDAESRALAARIPGWPRPKETVEPCAVVRGAKSNADRLLHMLLEKGILTTDAEVGKAPTPVEVDRPMDSLVDTVLMHTLLDDRSVARPTVTLRDFTNLAWAYLVAAKLVRWSTIAATVRRVSSRREECGPRCAPLDIERARELLRAFLWMRPFVFTSRDACLLDSLTLIEFLARYGVYPRWVFGVQTGPFGAHCWVQHDNVVFNDTPEHARGYVPIMAV